jgi:hypothetical protein
VINFDEDYLESDKTPDMTSPSALQLQFVLKTYMKARKILLHQKILVPLTLTL